MQTSQSRPTGIVPPAIDDSVGKIVFILSQALRLAELRSDAHIAMPSMRRSLQSLLRGKITPKEYIVELQQWFVSEQPIFQSYLESCLPALRMAIDQKKYPVLEHIRDSTFDDTQIITRSSSQAPPRLSPMPMIEPRRQSISLSETNRPFETMLIEPMESFDDHFDDFDVPLSPSRHLIAPLPKSISPLRQTLEFERCLPGGTNQIVKLEPSSTPPSSDTGKFATINVQFNKPLEPLSSFSIPPKIEPVNEFVSSNAILDFIKRQTLQNPNIESIATDAMNLLGECIEVQMRIFIEDVVKAARHRTSIPSNSNDLMPFEETRKLINQLDNYYYNQDKKNSRNDLKVVNTRNNAKQIDPSMISDANETALAAIGGGRKRNWSSTNTTAASSFIPTIFPTKIANNNPRKPLRITIQDVVSAMEKNDHLCNSWVYRNALYFPNIYQR